MHLVRSEAGRIIQGRGSSLKVLLEPAGSPVRNATLGVVEIAPGVRLPADEGEFSRHECEELSYLISGAMRVWVEGQEIIMRPGDALFTAPGERHWVRNDGDEPALALFVLAPPIDL